MLHTCSPYCRHDPAINRTAKKTSDVLTIDLHCHIVTPEVETLVASAPQKKAEPEFLLRMQGEEAYLQNQATYKDSDRRLSTMAERLSDMDNMGVDLQVISPSGVQYYYWADEALAEEIVRLQNTNLAEQCARHPKRLRGLGTIALQHPRLAVKQLQECVKDFGLQGVVVSSLINGKELIDPDFEPFWQAASELGCIVFLHPLGSSLGERLNVFNLSNVLGQPLETAVALSKLIFNGNFDRHSGVKLVAAHGGGYLASYIGRSEHGYAVRPEMRKMQHSPIEYLKKIWFDTVVHDPQVVRHLIDSYGASQIVLGTDYPYDMGGYDVHEFIASVPHITEKETRMILGGNAAALLGIDLAKGI